MSEIKVIDIIELVKKHPLNRLPANDNSILVNKIREKFPLEEQQLFIANFYCYLNYDTRKDYVVDLDNIWKWLGFGKKGDCKSLLVNNFVENEDYIAEKAASVNTEAGINKERNLGGAGLNKENILMTIKCFKKLCLKTKTKKSDEIHDYYISLEELINETVYEQSEQLRNQLLLNNSKLLQKEQNLLNNFNKKPVLYVGLVENDIVKFGFSDDIKTRLTDHKSNISKDFTIDLIYESVYNREIERRIKNHYLLSTKIITRGYGPNNKQQTELIRLDNNFTIKELDKIIIEIKRQIESDEFSELNKEILKLSKENSDIKLEFQKLKNNLTDHNDIKYLEMLEENSKLKLNIENSSLELEKCGDIKFLELSKENSDLKLEVHNLKEKIKLFENNEKCSYNIDLKSDCMFNLGKKLTNLRKNVCYNFMIDFIAKNILTNNGNTNFIIKLTMNDILEKYKKYRISNRFVDTVYDDDNEKNIITKAFNEVDGIKNCFIGKLNARAFYVDIISRWICENVNITPILLGIFRDSCNIVGTYCNVLNSEISDFSRKVYSFLIDLLLREKSEFGEITLVDFYIKEKLNKFMLQFEKKIINMNRVREVLLEIPGICRRSMRINEIKHNILAIDVQLSTNWIIDTLEIDKIYLDKLKTLPKN